MDSIFLEISAIVVVSTVFALFAKVIKQPIIIAFICTGILLGPIGLNVIQSDKLIDVLSSFGIALLLYIVGIELDIKKLRELSWPTILAGFGQVVVTGSLGWGTALLLGFSLVEGWFIAVTLTLSSTIVVVKLLSEKRQMDTLYGRIAMSILLLQDFAAIMAILLLESFGGESIGKAAWWDLLIIVAKTGLISLLAYVLARYVFKRIFLFIGRSQELLFLWSVAWCLFFAGLAELWNFPLSISVFIAGLMVGTLDYNYEISARIRSLRDFFIVIFFAFLGSQLVLALDARLLISAFILSLFVLIGNPLIVFIILRFVGHHERTSFYAGLTMAQISEFSFLLSTKGLEHGVISQELVSMIAVIGLVTMILSSYMIMYNERIYKWMRPVLKLAALPEPLHLKEELPNQMNNQVVIFGYHVTLDPILQSMKQDGETVVVIDYNPDNIDLIRKQGAYYIYGDMRDEDILKLANLSTAKLILSIVPYTEANMSLLQYIKHFGIKSDVVIFAQFLMDVERFYNAGATFVLHPESISLKYLLSVLSPEELMRASQLHKKELLNLIQHQLVTHGEFSTGK